ncbi:type I-C CRISPR-associated protein Cas8c/Csd1 [Paradesulfitobacterium aromaticivorans]
MIIHALYQYYERLLEDEDSGVSRPGYSRVRVSYAIILSSKGDLLNFVDLQVERDKKLVAREMNVPEQIKRASGVAANFMCDNCTYVLCLQQEGKKDKPKRRTEAFEAFVNLHEEVLSGIRDEGAEALLTFLHNWDIARAPNHPKVEEVLGDLSKGGNLVFRLEGKEGYLHERPAIMEAWDYFRSSHESEVISQCLVTGKKSPIARLHPNIKGVTGAQSSGASLVSFNLNAFTSYGKSQSYNAPISESAAFGYTTAINYLLGSQKHRIRIGDTSMVFWAERSNDGVEEDLIQALFFPNEQAENNGEESNTWQRTRDPRTVQLLHDVLSRIRIGAPIREGLTGVDQGVNFYILGLAPNASRLAVRFWHVDEYGKFLDKIGQHYSDMAIMKSYQNEPNFIPISMILKETAPLGDSKRIPPLLGGVLMRSILTGAPYPEVLYNSIIVRIKADYKINYVRAAMVKAYLVRKQRNNGRDEVRINMALDSESTNVAYRLGRLFALLEKAQQDATPGLNATIKDRFFGAASATPGSVFPILLRLAQHHIAKAEYGRSTDKRIEEVINSIQTFPAHLNLDEQGLFVLGYYHQRQALFTKKEEKRDN